MTSDDNSQKPAGNQPGDRPSSRRRGRRPEQNRSARSQNMPSSAVQPPESGQPIPLPPTTGRKPAAGDSNRTRQPTGNGVQNRPAQQPGKGHGRPRRQPGGADASQTSHAQNRPRRRTDNGQAVGENGQPNRPPRREDTVQPSKASEKPQNRTQRRRPAGATTPAAAVSTERATSRRSGSRTKRPTYSTWDRAGSGSHFPASIPRQAHGGIRARSERGEFGKNWWAKRWLLAMERLMDGARLQRGRRYARMGQVLSMSEDNAGIVAKVQGSRPQPYKVTIRVSPLTDEQWDKVLDVLADQAIFTAQLLAGEMPADIEEAFSAAGVSLFPARGGDLMTECSCPDWANPCKHIAATHYILGDRFDEDPFLIFRMRGRDQESILQGLRLRRAGQEEPLPEEPTPLEVEQPLDQDLAHFWEIRPGLEDYSVNVQPPQVDLPLLKRLGQPDFARNLSLEQELGAAYEAISQAAMLLAFSDTTREAPENGSEAS